MCLRKIELKVQNVPSFYVGSLVLKLQRLSDIQNNCFTEYSAGWQLPHLLHTAVSILFITLLAYNSFLMQSVIQSPQILQGALMAPSSSPSGGTCCIVASSSCFDIGGYGVWPTNFFFFFP